MRTPSAVVSRTIASATARASSGRASADSTTPGRPFFICTGVVQTSRAPAAKARAAASGTSSPGVSSRFVSITITSPPTVAGSLKLADEDAHDVGHLRHVARPGAVADALEHHRRDRAVALHGRREQGGRGRRDELDAQVERHERRAAQQLQRRGRRQRQPAVRGLDEPARARDGRALDAVDAELLERQRDAADVGQRVEAADLVEVHELGLAVVHAGLGLGQQPERLVRPARGALGQPGGVDQLAHVGQVPVDVLLVRHHDLDAARGDAVPHRAPDLQVEALDPEGAHVLGHPLGARTGVDQGSQQHVAGGTTDAIDVGDAGHEAPAARRAMRAAIVPAPKPSSMLTQATPAAHDESMASRAVTPPKDAP